MLSKTKTINKNVKGDIRDKIQLIGYLDKDPEIETHKKTRKMATLSFATVVSWRAHLHEGWTANKWPHPLPLNEIRIFKKSIIAWLIRDNIKKADLLFVQGHLAHGDEPNSPIIVTKGISHIFRIYESKTQANLESLLSFTPEAANDQ